MNADACFTTQRRVAFRDTDAAGIMHFSVFFVWMEEAEHEFLRSRGLSVSWLDGDTRYGLPRVSTGCDFQKPAKFEDVLTIAVTIEKIGRKSLSYRFDFTRGSDAIAVGRITSVFCRAGGPDHLESIEIPPAIRAKLEQ